MWLNIGIVRAEQFHRTLDRQFFSNINIFAAAVVALARVTLGVFVGQYGALGFHHARACVVLGGNQLDMLLLAACLIGNSVEQF